MPVTKLPARQRKGPVPTRGSGPDPIRTDDRAGARHHTTPAAPKPARKALQFIVDKHVFEEFSAEARARVRLRERREDQYFLALWERRARP